MATYVDDMKAKSAKLQGRQANYVFCHMIADTEDELHEMADKIGVARKWYQIDASWPHYDITQTKRSAAIFHGAKPVTMRELVMVIQDIKRRRALWARAKIILKKLRES